MSKPEATAKWIERRLTRVLKGYPEQEIKRTMPVILMFMAQEFGLENLDPKFQEAVHKVICAAGVTPEMSPKQVNAKMSAFVKSLEVNEALLADIKQVFDQHHAALSERVIGGFKRMIGLKPKAPAKVGESRPKDALTLDSFAFARRL